MGPRCVYDNPQTWTREWWDDGVLVYCEQAEYSIEKHQRGDAWPWKPGTVRGNAEAMPSDSCGGLG